MSPKVNYDSIGPEEIGVLEANSRPHKNLSMMSEEDKIKGINLKFMAAYLGTVSVGMF